MFGAGAIPTLRYQRSTKPFLVRHSRLPLLLTLAAAIGWFGLHARHARLNDSLVRAVRDGDAAAVHRCLGDGADANVKIALTDPRKQPPSFVAKVRVAFHGEVPTPDGAQQSMLVNAIITDKDAILRDLLAHGARPNDHTPSGYTALHVACRFGKTAAVRALLAHGADPNARDRHGRTPGHVLLMRQDPEDEVILRVLRDHTAPGESAGELNGVPVPARPSL